MRSPPPRAPPAGGVPPVLEVLHKSNPTSGTQKVVELQSWITSTDMMHSNNRWGLGKEGVSQLLPSSLNSPSCKRQLLNVDGERHTHLCTFPKICVSYCGWGE